MLSSSRKACRHCETLAQMYYSLFSVYITALHYFTYLWGKFAERYKKRKLILSSIFHLSESTQKKKLRWIFVKIYVNVNFTKHRQIVIDFKEKKIKSLKQWHLNKLIFCCTWIDIKNVVEIRVCLVSNRHFRIRAIYYKIKSNTAEWESKEISDEVNVI